VQPHRQQRVSRPRQIGRYLVEDAVAEGSTAIVYRARDPAINRTVAIKLLKTGPEVDEEFLQRFEREAQFAGAVSHPNIVTIFDVGRVNGTPYITMEYLAEKSLAEIIAGDTPLTIKRVISIGLQLAHALDHAHRHGVIHRDLKPDNVLLVNGGETVKLTDFGVAGLAAREYHNRTTAGTVLGTPRYMSPEQAMGRALDPRTDLYSLGAILYQLLTGRLPFDASNLALLMLQIVQQEPAPIASLAPEVPQGLQRAVHKLLAKRPEQRYQTAQQLAEVLQRELAMLEVQEREASRNRFLPLRLKLALVAGVVLGAVFLSSMAVVYKVEAGVLQAHTLASGGLLARFVALHAAVPALEKNWLPLRVFAEDGRSRGNFDYLVITDHRHIVQAATQPQLIGGVYQGQPLAELLQRSTDLTTRSAMLADGRSVFLFDTPVLFQKTEVGRVYLGVNRAGMDRVLNATFWLMALLAAIAIGAVLGLSQFFGLLILRPIRLLKRSLTQIGDGDLDVRISEKRKDEIGQIYAAFNAMADKLQARTAQSAPQQPPVPVPQMSGGQGSRQEKRTVRARVTK
jgi:HAMP domain-containing protein/tRNA A-37 threonylcarbamoyl transferase component Bud32